MSTVDELLGRLPPVQAFGTWDAPVTDDAVWLPEVPTHMTCVYCHEHFEPGDNGAIMGNGFAQHRECSLRGIFGGIGHQVDHDHYCRGELGPDADLPYRLSARLVWATRVKGMQLDRDALELIRWMLGREP